MSNVPMIPTLINEKWSILLPEDQAVRPFWPYWEKERLASMYENIKTGDIVFDVGAAWGDFPALFTMWGANTVLFEPNPLVWPNIRVTWEANQLPMPKGYFVGFASNHTDEHPFAEEEIIRQPERDGWPACAYGEVIGNHGFRNVIERYHDTPQIKIDDYCKKYDIYPDLMTLDVEGAEFEVLKGAEDVLRNRKPLVYVSIHPESMANDYPYTDVDLHAFMASLGYSGEHLATDHEVHYLFRPGT